MKFVDLSAAGVISITAVALLLAWNPQAPDVEGRRNIDVANLRDILTAASVKIGVTQIIQDSPGELCSLVGSLSNSTVEFSAEVGGSNCSEPPVGAALAELTFAVGPKVVVLECWHDEKV
jgi:hypothetical protein